MPTELVLIFICSLVLAYFWKVILALFFWVLVGAAALGLITAVSYFVHLQ